MPADGMPPPPSSVCLSLHFWTTGSELRIFVFVQISRWRCPAATVISKRYRWIHVAQLSERILIESFAVLIIGNSIVGSYRCAGHFQQLLSNFYKLVNKKARPTYGIWGLDRPLFFWPSPCWACGADGMPPPPLSFHSLDNWIRAAQIFGYYKYLIKGALCAEVKRPRVSYNQNDETLSRNSLRYLSKANLTIAVNCSCRVPLKDGLITPIWGLGRPLFFGSHRVGRAGPMAFRRRRRLLCVCHSIFLETGLQLRILSSWPWRESDYNSFWLSPCWACGADGMPPPPPPACVSSISSFQTVDQGCAYVLLYK